jgi:tetratricopeptide (TPR) repeat protein
MNRERPRAAGNPGRAPAGNPPRGTATAAVEPSVADCLAAGLAHHRAGRLAEAEVHYRRILAAVPDHADALHLLGVIAYQFGRLEMAIELIGRALQQNGNDPAYYCSCGLVLQSLKRLDEAVASHERALTLKPDYAEALINRGLALEELKRFAEARESYDRALALRPHFAGATPTLALSCTSRGSLAKRSPPSAEPLLCNPTVWLSDLT